MTKKRTEILDYKQLSSKVYVMCIFQATAAVAGCLLYYLVADNAAGVVYSLCYGVYMIFALVQYRFFDRYEGKLFGKFRLYSVISALLAASLIAIMLIYPDMLKGYVTTRGGNSVDILTSAAVLAAGVALIPAIEFVQVSGMVSSPQRRTDTDNTSDD